MDAQRRKDADQAIALLEQAKSILDSAAELAVTRRWRRGMEGYARTSPSQTQTEGRKS
jgi:hypothetical protein